MPGSTSVSKNIRELKKSSKKRPHKQVVAIAIAEAKKKKTGR